MTRVVLATRNQGKVRELTDMLKDQDIEVLGLESFPEIGEIEETGQTFEDNARIKAKAVSLATGLIAIADDSGLAVDAIEGRPGVYSARFSGENATDASNNALLLEVMDGVPEDKRACKFLSAVAVHAPDGHELVFHGVWLGRLATEPKGEGGFGYDPLFFDPELKLTAAQMTPEQKNARSHRGRAVAEMVKYLPGFIAKVEREAARPAEEREFITQYAGVKGVLKFLCWIMMAGAPFVALRTVLQNADYMRIMGKQADIDPKVAAELSKALVLESGLNILVAGLMVWAGLCLYRAKKGAPLLAKIAWLAVPLAGAVQLGAAYLFNYPPDTVEKAVNRELFEALPGIGLAVVAVYYLNLSRRVKATYEMQ